MSGTVLSRSFSDCPCDVEYDYASAGVDTGKHGLPRRSAAPSMNEERNFSSRLRLIEDLDDLYDTAPCGYLSVLPDGSIGKVNGTLVGWTGHRQEAMLGRPFLDFLSAAGRASYESQLVPSLPDSGRLIETTLELLMADGRSLPVLATAVVRNDALGNALFTRFMFLPLNERRRFQQGLIEARAALKLTIKRLESEAAELQNRISDEKRQRRAAEGVLYEEREDAELREQFVAVLGHDLRNPPAAIRGGLRMLGRDAVGSQATVLALMDVCVARMASLIDDVMDFARGRLGGGIGIERHEGQDLNPITAQVVDELRSAQPSGMMRPISRSRSWWRAIRSASDRWYPTAFAFGRRHARLNVVIGKSNGLGFDAVLLELFGNEFEQFARGGWLGKIRGLQGAVQG